MAVDPIVVKHGPWSISKLGVIEQCSLKYDFKYGGQKQPELVQFADNRIGVAVHKALELALGGYSISDAIMHARDQGELTSSESEELDARHEQMERFVAKMVEFRRKHSVVTDCIEEKWGMSTDYQWTGFFGDRRKSVDVFFRGVVDLAMLTRKGDIIIIDHKDYYQTQLRVYALMGLARFPEARGVQAAINFVMPDKLEWGKYVTAAEIRSTYAPWLEEHMSKVCANLQEEPKPSTSKLCDWCGYKPICPAQREVTRGATSNP